MPLTYEAIANVTLGAANSTIQISSIPQTYTDLVIIYSVRGSATNVNTYFRFNSNSTGANYGQQLMYSSGATNTGYRFGSGNEFVINYQNSLNSLLFNHGRIDIFNYTGTSNRKSILYTFNRDGNFLERGGGTWNQTSAISTVSLHASVNSFAANSTMALYGILKA